MTARRDPRAATTRALTAAFRSEAYAQAAAKAARSIGSARAWAGVAADCASRAREAVEREEARGEDSPIATCDCWEYAATVIAPAVAGPFGTAGSVEGTADYIAPAAEPCARREGR